MKQYERSVVKLINKREQNTNSKIAINLHRIKDLFHILILLF